MPRKVSENHLRADMQQLRPCSVEERSLFRDGKQSFLFAWDS